MVPVRNKVESGIFQVQCDFLKGSGTSKLMLSTSLMLCMNKLWKYKKIKVCLIDIIKIFDIQTAETFKDGWIKIYKGYKTYSNNAS